MLLLTAGPRHPQRELRHTSAGPGATFLGSASNPQCAPARLGSHEEGFVTKPQSGAPLHTTCVQQPCMVSQAQQKRTCACLCMHGHTTGSAVHSLTFPAPPALDIRLCPSSLCAHRYTALTLPARVQACRSSRGFEHQAPPWRA